MNMYLKTKPAIIFLACLFFLFFLINFSAGEAQAQIIFESNFETGAIQCNSCNPDGWNVRIDNGPASAVQVLSSNQLPLLPRLGNYALRVHAERNSSQTTTRAELEGYGQRFFELKKEYWVGFSVYLPDNSEYNFDTNQVEILNQFRHRDDSACAASGVSPPNALRALNGHWWWDIRCSDTACSCDGNNRMLSDLGVQERGKWTDVVERLYFSNGSDGIIQVYLNGRQVYSRTGKPNYYNNSQGPYLKVGFYKSGWSSSSNVTTRTIYYDAVKVYQGTNGFSLVSPGSIPTTPTVLTPTRTPTPIVTSSPSSAKLKFKISLPDIAAATTNISAADTQLELKDGTISLAKTSVGLIRNGSYFQTQPEASLNIPQNKNYSIWFKTKNSIRKIFNGVSLIQSQTLDCTVTVNSACGELINQRDNKLFYSGDSDGFDIVSGSFNRIDSVDLQALSIYFNQPVTGTAQYADYNLDNQINISDLEILGRNYGKQGD